MRAMTYLLFALTTAAVCGRVWAPETTTAIAYLVLSGELPR